MPLHDDVTPNLGLPLPHVGNLLDDDGGRIRDALMALDAEVSGKQPSLGFAPLPASQKGSPSGVAPLDSAGKVPAVYLPSFVDDVVMVANFGALPVSGESGKIYVLEDTGRQFRWTGASMVELHPSPGTTDDVVEGTSNLYFTPERVLDAVPVATESQRGLVRVGPGLGVAPDGLIFAVAGAGSFMSMTELHAAADGDASIVVPGGYVVGGIMVVLNGSALGPSDFTATDSATVSFTGLTLLTTDTVLIFKLSTVAIGTLPTGSVGATQLAIGSVTTEKIAAGASGDVGDIKYTARSTPPSALWRECDGAALSRTGYPELFAAIGTLYGAGDGVTTFNIPDNRGEFIRSLDSGRGVDPGRVVGSRQKGTLTGWDVGQDAVWVLQSTSGGSASQAAVGADAYVTTDYAGVRLGGIGDESWQSLPGGAGGGGEVSTGSYSGVVRPRNVAHLCIIKVK